MYIQGNYIGASETDTIRSFREEQVVPLMIGFRKFIPLFNFHQEQIENQFTLDGMIPSEQNNSYFPSQHSRTSIISSRHKSSVTLLQYPTHHTLTFRRWSIPTTRTRTSPLIAERCDVPNKSNLANSSNWIPFRLQKCFPSWCSSQPSSLPRGECCKVS